MSPLLRSWDERVLMRMPILWQLRLHWFFPLALLWTVVVTGLWLAWAAEPARWMGSSFGSIHDWRTPEETMLGVSVVVAWIGALALAFTWLLRARIHNRWHECAPAPRLGVWWEYLWGAALLTLLFAPALTLEPLYASRVQQLWRGADVSAQIQATGTVGALDLMLDPRSAAALVEWSRTLDTDTPTNDRETDYVPLKALGWLVHGDHVALAATLEQYANSLRPWGYTPVDDASSQDQASALLAAYQAALQSPLALEWRSYRAQHPPRQMETPPQSDDGTDDDSAPNECRMQRWQFDNPSAPLAAEPSRCFPYYAQMTDTQWRDMLQGLSQKMSSPRIPKIVRWSHPRYGMAMPQRQRSHLQHAERTKETTWTQRKDWLHAACAGLFAALALVIARLMSPRQITVWAAGLVLAAPATILLGMLGVADTLIFSLAPALLLLVAWVRIALLRRPWGGSLLLGLALVLGVMGAASLWEAASQWLHVGTHYSHTNAQPDDATRWLNLLLGMPPVALLVALLVALTAPLWRRWRGLPER
ncbi:MAG: hypothetical protein ACTS5V_11640 [Giesbergeria sp.]